MHYAKHAIHGVSWLTVLRVSTRGITIIRTIIFARILTPVQFGVFGIATLLLSLLEIFTETGINVFLIQEKKDLKEYVNDAWVVSIVRGILLASLILITAPFIAQFFNSPESLGIIRLISIVPLARGFINPSMVRLQKDLTFRKEFYFRFLIFAFESIVSVVLVVLLKSVSGLIWGMFAGVMLEVFLSFMYIHPRPQFVFDTKKIKFIFQRGKWVTFSGICNYFGENGDNIAVGKLLGTAPLGIYQIAYKLSILPISEISDVVNRVVFPIYTKINDDKKRLFRAFSGTTVFISISSVILGIFIYYFASPIVLLLLGHKWVTAIPVIQVLAIYGVVRAISGSFTSLFLAVNRQEYVAMMVFVRFITLVLIIVPFVLKFGLIGAGYSALLSVIIEFPIAAFFVIKIFKIKK